MALQNRVNPEGEICFTSARGTLMGNRGCLHNEAKEIVICSKRDAWVTCSLEFKNRSRTVMGSGTYTELFFLDEATALAAGHRPCATCRRKHYDAFIAAWSVGNRNGTKVLASDMDKEMKRDRAPGARLEVSTVLGYPDGTIVKERATGTFYLIYGASLHQWSFEGYRPAKRPSMVNGQFIVMTPACTIKALQSGYVAQVHTSCSDLHLS